jgi:hypothetical protein
MNKKLKWLIALTGAALLITAIAIPAFAAGPLGKTNTQNADAQYGYGKGLGIGLNDNVTALLGLTTEEIQTQREAGKSLVQIAQAQGITEEILVNTIMAEKQTALKAMVTAGTISQEIADLRLAQMRERVQESVNRTDVGPQSWSRAQGNGQRGGCGMMGLGNGSGNNLSNENVNPGTGKGFGGMMRGGRGTW